MRPAIALPGLILLWCSAALSARAQTPADSARLVVISPVVGEVIDAGEKATYGLFPYYSANNFEEARLYRALRPDSALTLRARLRDGRTALRPISADELAMVRRSIEERVRNVGTAAPLGAPTDSVGQHYQVTLRSGTSFTGTLVALRPRELEFDTPDLGRVLTPRASIVELLPLLGKRRPWEYVGNGTRLFFAPTARNLRRGEGYVQSLNLLLAGANYGLTDHFSVGVLASLIPSIPFYQQAFAITPKLSTPLRNDNWHVGGGVLYATAGGTGLGVAYGVTTFGTANRNVTFGLGYGFGGGELARSPVFLLGGATRVGRRISLMSENYLFAAGRGNGVAAGLYGMRLNWPRATFSLGALYFASRSAFFSTYIYPVYLDLSYRFGQVK
ncbi:hypothetical protein EJV47_19560 [Hymenobacter gummosus]|uniref:Uncharacterized protein n=1 Tax=Hymenobacter gummosus TaxID=1776032 RepID=A0A3S0IKZ0_9BACT|nr:hypothetical protein [Hymenobacter gummosus]RTQ47096.1 hypothetical protein EJV47_19560 [Hymenobacter gummosus]